MDGVGLVVFVLLVGAAVAFLTFVLLRQQPSTYEGRVVDKSITLSETQQGSGKVMRLHIRGANGESQAVRVDFDTYNRAQVGMWARNEGKGVELSWDNPPAGAATKTEGAETPSVSAPR